MGNSADAGEGDERTVVSRKMTRTTLLDAMERRDVEIGLQVMCEAGGLANATIIERI